MVSIGQKSGCSLTTRTLNGIIVMMLKSIQKKARKGETDMTNKK